MSNTNPKNEGQGQMFAAVTPLKRTTQTPFVARIPGSKSFTNRALVLAAQRQGTTTIEGALHSEDTELLADCLNRFKGLTTAKTSGGFIVERDRAKLSAPDEELYIGAAGTPARFLMSFAAAADGATVITGTKRLCERPMDHLLQSMARMGIRYECLLAPGHLPVRIWGGPVATPEWTVDGSVSSQFLSSLLIFAAQQSEERIAVRVPGHLVSKPYVAMTVQMLRDCGVAVEARDDQTWVVRPSEPQKSRIDIEVDASGMSYFLAAGALTRSKVIIPGIGRESAQGDVGFARILESMGCRVRFNKESIELDGAPLHGVDVDMETMPDTVLTLAAAASQAVGPTRITNIANLRVKECDRIHAAVTELRRLGVDAEDGPDYITIRPTGRVTPDLVHTYDDHRVAMSFGLLRLLHEGIDIENEACVGKSFPGFWAELARFRNHHDGGRLDDVGGPVRRQA
jgi:3-phosphoshikimate 1-carboxyvinyltransferase